MLSSKEIEERVIKYREKNNLPKTGAASSNIRRQLKRLRDKFLVEKINNKYRILENLPLEVIFEEKIKKFLLNITINSIENYLKYYSNINNQKNNKENENKTIL